MPLKRLASFLLMPELNLVEVKKEGIAYCVLYCLKQKKPEYCPKCAHPSESTYDTRVVRLKDATIHGQQVKLVIKKRRLWCKPCQRPFTEPVPGVRKGVQHTERYGRALRFACEKYSDLKSVKRQFRCSYGFLYKTYYRHLELRARRNQHEYWPKKIGIDEHAFGRNKHYGFTEFACLIVNHSNKKVIDVIEGKTTASLEQGLAQIKARENVRFATMDMCDPFKNFVKSFFPNAQIVADKFHVLRLLTPALLKKRYEIVGTRADLRAKKLLLMSSYKLGYFEQRTLREYLKNYPELDELYQAKESLHRFYRIKGYDRAKQALLRLCDQFGYSTLKEIQTLRKTLIKWRTEILNYFKSGLTNARVEGYNNLAKSVLKRAYGYRSFKNYRLRLLDACS